MFALDRDDPGHKRYLAGTHRSCDPAETVARVVPLMPALGITRLSDITRLDRVGVPVFMACRPNARSLSVFQGKGLSADAARASALMEALEFWHAERVTLPLRRCSERELRLVAPVVDTTRLARTTTCTYHEDRRILWVEGRDLLSEAPCWVPYDLVHTDYTLPHTYGCGDFAMSSNGLASGNHPLEALTHALCELVERDACTSWQEGHDYTTDRLALESVDHPEAAGVIARFRAAGLLLGVWDVTSDVGLPCFVAEIIEEDPDPTRRLHAARGEGCHLDRGVALLRALTEAAQGRLTLIAGSRDDLSREAYLKARSAAVLDQIHARLSTSAAGGPTFAGVPTRSHETHAEDVRFILGRLQERGLSQVIVVDLTHPGLRVPVLRVIVPGLEPGHDQPGYRPGPRAQRRGRA